MGFTLIELLVVVLIIGILAAVALPQYQKAVEKSKAAQAWTVLKTVSQAVAAHYMASGSYPTSFDELAVNMDTWTGTEQWKIGGHSITRSNGEWSLQLYQTNAGALQMYMGRLTGKYRGGGFVKTVINESGKLVDTPIYCAERIYDGVVLEGSEGAYCQKIFHGGQAIDSGSYRFYALP